MSVVIGILGSMIIGAGCWQLFKVGRKLVNKYVRHIPDKPKIIPSIVKFPTVSASREFPISVDDREEGIIPSNKREGITAAKTDDKLLKEIRQKLNAKAAEPKEQKMPDEPKPKNIIEYLQRRRAKRKAKQKDLKEFAKERAKNGSTIAKRALELENKPSATAKPEKTDMAQVYYKIVAAQRGDVASIKWLADNHVTW